MNRKQKKARLERMRDMENAAADRRRREQEEREKRMRAWEAGEAANQIWAELLDEGERIIRRREDKPLTSAAECW